MKLFIYLNLNYQTWDIFNALIYTYFTLILHFRCNALYACLVLIANILPLFEICVMSLMRCCS